MNTVRALFSGLVRRLRRLGTPICWWRGKHRGVYSRGRWVCRMCGHERSGKAPPGTLLTDESAKHLYVAGPHGELLRADKVRGGKKVRRRKRELVEKAELLRQHYLGGDR